MSHLALARKYRPRRFGEVATQEHVSETLRRAVSGNRVGHAYLFCGPRGVGKTTLARVLAMALNCAERTPEGEPCAACRSCERIWAGHTSLDVVEIDAASNRGVDDARDLRQRAMYAPSEEGRHKVYILDEAHMLTREAWNALLKILEEPPPRVIFVFATTEVRKIEQTASPILSRCQRFDFRRIGTSGIKDRLAEVLDAEEVGYAPEALSAIARRANGGMRDGLSLLDQVLALSDRQLEVDTVVRVLGVVPEERYLDVFDIVAEHRHGDVFEFMDELVREGYDPVEFYHGLAERTRLLLQLSVGGKQQAGEGMAGEALAQYGKRAAAFAPGDLLRMLVMAADLETDGSLRRTGQPRLLVEMLLLRMSYMDRTVELEEVVRALGGKPAAPASDARASRPAASSGQAAASGRGAAESSAGSPRSGGGEAPGRASAPDEASGPASAVTETSGRASAATPASASAPASSPPRPPLRDPTSSPPASPPNELASPAPGPSPHSPAAPPPTASASPPQGQTPLATAWQAVLGDPESLPPGLRPFLRGATAEERGGRLEVTLPPGPGVAKAQAPAVLRRLNKALALHSGRDSAEILFTVESDTSDLEREPGSAAPAEDPGEARMKEAVKRTPALQAAVAELDLDFVD